jgi:3-methyladenine DNA glycosylase/8-oxoguanine DNA glycosylase
MSEAVDNLHAIERLVALAGIGPGADANALQEARSVLARMGLGTGATGYKAEKLKVVSDGFESGRDRSVLMRDIDHLRKALARGAEGQD